MLFLFLYSKMYWGSFRSSHQSCSMEKGVFKNFSKFTERHLCQSLFFNKVAGLRLATLLKKTLCHRCFPVNFVKLSRTPFYTEILRTTAFLAYVLLDQRRVGSMKYPSSVFRLSACLFARSRGN